jgi:multidrug resistance protein, MATE family
LNGAGNWRDLYRVSWAVVRKSVLIGAMLSLLYLAGYATIGTWFTADPSVLALLSGVFWLVVITQPINAVAFAFDGVYKGLGNGKLLRNVLLASTLLAFVPVIVVLDRSHFQLYAIWWAFLAWMFVRGLLLALHFRKRYGPLARREARIA